MFAALAVSRRSRLARAAAIARRPVTLVGLVATFILVIFVASPGAGPQQPAFGTGGARVAPPPEPTEIDLLVGRSTVLNVDRQIERVSLTTPDIADALVTSPQQILIHGKTPGTISLFVWDRAGGIKSFEVRVRRDLSALAEQVRQLFPGEPISVAGNGRDVVISGTVSSKYVVEKAADVAAGYVEKKDNVVNLLKQREGVASNQVMLRVRFAEVSRSALTELGASYFTGPNGFHDYVSRVTTQQFPAPNYDELTRTAVQGENNWGGGRDTVIATGGKATFSDFLNIFLFNNKYSIGMVVKALSDKGLFQSLAEPNLIATNGREASFLAGGEYPYPVVQPGSGGNAITIQFKEYGIRLTFTPTVLGGDLVNLKVRPEVSALDFTNALTLQGFRVPAISTRRTETEVELADGQTFAIAGLLNNQVTSSLRKIPGIGDIPILGWLFKSQAMQKNQTELVVMITPQILQRGSTGVSNTLPDLAQPFLGPQKNPLPPPAPWVPKKDDQANSAPPAPQSGQAAPVAQPTPPAPAAAPAPGTGSVRLQPDQPSAPQPAQAAPAVQPPAPKPNPAPTLTKAQQKQLEEQQKAEAKRAAEEAKRVTEETRRAAEQAQKARVQQEKLAQEQAKKDAEAAKKAAELAEAQRIAQEKQAREIEQAQAEAAKRAFKDAEKQREAQEKLARDQAKKDAEAKKKAAEIAKKQQKEEQERAKVLAEAEARLREARAAYQAALKKPGGGN